MVEYDWRSQKILIHIDLSLLISMQINLAAVQNPLLALLLLFLPAGVGSSSTDTSIYDALPLSKVIASNKLVRNVMK